MPSPQDLRKVAIMQLMDDMIQDDKLQTTQGIFRLSGSSVKVGELVAKIEKNEAVDFSALDKTIKTSLLKKLIKDFYCEPWRAEGDGEETAVGSAVFLFTE